MIQACVKWPAWQQGLLRSISKSVGISPLVLALVSSLIPVGIPSADALLVLLARNSSLPVDCNCQKWIANGQMWIAIVRCKIILINISLNRIHRSLLILISINAKIIHTSNTLLASFRASYQNVIIFKTSQNCPRIFICGNYQIWQNIIENDSGRLIPKTQVMFCLWKWKCKWINCPRTSDWFQLGSRSTDVPLPISYCCLLSVSSSSEWNLPHHLSIILAKIGIAVEKSTRSGLEAGLRILPIIQSSCVLLSVSREDSHLNEQAWSHRLSWPFKRQFYSGFGRNRCSAGFVRGINFF